MTEHTPSSVPLVDVSNSPVFPFLASQGDSSTGDHEQGAVHPTNAGPSCTSSVQGGLEAAPTAPLLSSKGSDAKLGNGRHRWIPEIVFPWRRLSQQPPGILKRLPQGWRFGATVAAMLAGCVLVVNALTAIALHRHAHRGDAANIRSILSGSCEEVNNAGHVVHLMVNIVSTLLIGGSNYCMQCLSAPTREGIDKAHKKGTWLHVGIHNLRNLWFAGGMKLFLWLCLGISSVPLHLIYNSVFFTTMRDNSYDVYFVANSFEEGAWFDHDLFPPQTPSWTTVDIQHGNSTIGNSSLELDAFAIRYQTDPRAIQSMTMDKRKTAFKKLDTQECIRSYSKMILPDRRNVILVATNTPRDVPSFADAGLMSDKLVSCNSSILPAIPTYDLGLVSCQNSSLYAVMPSLDQAFATSEDRSSSYWFKWICSQGDFYNATSASTRVCSNGGWKDQLESPRWSVFDFEVGYCLSEEIDSQCSFDVELSLLMVVILFNIIKVVVMTTVVRNIRDQPLITIGDAASSFIKSPDTATYGMCLFSKDHMIGRREGLSNKSEVSNRCSSITQECFQPKITRWYKACSRRHWILAMSLTLVALIIILSLFGYATFWLEHYYSKSGIKTLWSFGLATVNPYTIIQWDLPTTGEAAIVSSVLIANLPQILLSFLYMILNSLFTSMSLAGEFNRFSYRRRTLRVSDPHGDQRSTYFLQIPYRLGIPLLIASAFLHWIVSQSLFLVRIADGSADGDPEPMSELAASSDVITTCGYSPMGMIATSITILSIAAFALAISAKKLRPGIPLAGSCSMAIAAACHVPEGTSDLLPLQWGVIPNAKSDGEDDVGHCAFSNEEVEAPVPGRRYA